MKGTLVAAELKTEVRPIARGEAEVKDSHDMRSELVEWAWLLVQELHQACLGGEPLERLIVQRLLADELESHDHRAAVRRESSLPKKA